MNLVPLYEQAIQFNDYNGTVLAAGKVEVWYLGRTRKADIYADVAGETPLPNPLDLNDLGMQEVYVNPAFNYTLVVYDPYGSELFSVDKYLQGAGAHTTSNVVVQPSEHIGVSAWTVGEVQIYQPYLTGQLGKVYTGIEPIVVNNVEDKISAQHVPLGVQDPLYFVQDDEEGCIIGCSAQTEIPAELSGKWDNASDVVIANSAQWAEGTTYEAGSYVDIDGHTINVTGLQPAGNYQSAGDYVVHDELSSYATQDWVNEQGFLTAHQSLNGLMSADLLEFSGSVITAYSGHKFAGEISGDPGDPEVNALVHANSATWNTVSNKLDTTAFSTVSGSFLTAHQSLDGLMSSTLLEISDNKITGYNGTAFAGQGGVTGDFELSAGSGISIVDYPLEQKTVISVTAQGGNPEVEQAVIDNSATWNSVTSKADVTAIPSTAGLATENWVTSQGYLTGVDLTPYQTTAGMTAYATIESLTAKQDAGDYLSATDSANFLLTSDSANFYPMNENPSGYLTAHQSLADYQTTADMVNYQTTAGMTAYANSAEVTGTAQYGLTTAGWSEITGGSVPTGVMTESGLEYDASGNISAYSGSAFAAQLPEEEEVEFEELDISGISAATDYVSANSANINSTVTNVSANSGAWGGSALPISAGPGVKISLVDNTLVFSNDETVLWSATAGSATTATSCTLSEDWRNFDHINIQYKTSDGWINDMNLYGAMASQKFMITCDNYNGSNYWVKPQRFNISNTAISFDYGAQYTFTTTSVSRSTTGAVVYLYKIVGVNRTAGGN